MALALLGLGVTVDDSMAGDDDIAAYYEALAAEYDPVWAMNEYYIALEQAHPWLVGALNPLTGWMQSATDHQREQVTTFARLLSTVSLSGATEEGMGELLGSVHAHLATAGHRRSQVFDYAPIAADMLEMLTSHDVKMVRKMRNFIDAWCGPGNRARALIRVMDMFDVDPAGIGWHLNDPNALSVAVAGLNLVGEPIGTNVKLTSDRRFAELWSARSPSRGLFRLPPEESYTSPKGVT